MTLDVARIAIGHRMLYCTSSLCVCVFIHFFKFYYQVVQQVLQ